MFTVFFKSRHSSSNHSFNLRFVFFLEWSFAKFILQNNCETANNIGRSRPWQRKTVTRVATKIEIRITKKPKRLNIRKKDDKELIKLYFDEEAKTTKKKKIIKTE